MESRPEEQDTQEMTVLIIADDAEFARTLTSRWQLQRNVPAFTLMSGDLCPGINPLSFDLAIVGEVRPGVLPSVLTILESSGKTVIFVASDSKTAYTVRETHPRVLVLPQYDGWLDAVLLIACEGLRAAEAQQRARAAEQAARANEANATLGRYMLETRHFLNDALTSVLGNSELLLVTPGALSEQGREQVETIRNMGLRMHEILQRFSSVETELRYVEKYAAQQSRLHAQSAVAGTGR